jgi:N-acyl homoserine lactone hydrolase
MFEIYPLHVATLKQVDKSVLTSLKDAGEKIDLNCIAWVIRSHKAVYVVDPGPGHDVMRAKNIHHREMSIEGCTDLLRGLKNLGIMPSDVNAIINTHLHWDHCIANDSLPGIPVIVQHREYEYAKAPLRRDDILYESSLSYSPVNIFQSRMRFVEGDCQLEDGLELIFTPGHTPGHQSIKVRTQQKEYLIAGDQFDLYENYECCHPVGLYVNLFDWYQSYEKVKRMNVEVLPSHDPLLMSRKVY